MNKESFYQICIFLQGSEAVEALELLDSEGPGKAADYLSKWDYGDSAVIAEGEPWDSRDDVVEVSTDLYLTWNKRMGSIGLCRRLARKEQAEHEVRLAALL